MVPVWVWLSLHPVPSIWLRGNLANRWPSRPWNRQSPLIPLQPTVIPDNPGLIPNCVRGIAAGASYWEPGQVTADSVGSVRTLPSNGTTARGQWRQRVHPIRLFINEGFWSLSANQCCEPYFWSLLWTDYLHSACRPWGFAFATFLSLRAEWNKKWKLYYVLNIHKMEILFQPPGMPRQTDEARRNIKWQRNTHITRLGLGSYFLFKSYPLNTMDWVERALNNEWNHGWAYAGRCTVLFHNSEEKRQNHK